MWITYFYHLVLGMYEVVIFCVSRWRSIWDPNCAQCTVPRLFCVPLCVKGCMRAHKQLCRMSHVFCIIYQSKRHFIAHIFLSLNCSECPQSFVHVYSLKKHIIALILLTSLLYNLRYFVPGLLAGGGALWACSRLPLSSRGWVPCNVAETARECSVSMFASLWPV